MTTEEMAGELAEQIAKECFRGVLPVGFAPQIARAVAKTCCAGANEIALGQFLESLIIALQARMAVQDARFLS